MTARDLSQPARTARALAALLLLMLTTLTAASAIAAPKAAGEAPQLEYRARLTRVQPAQPCVIEWRYGGQGLGGDVHTGMVTREKPGPPAKPGETTEDFMAILEGPPKDRIIVEGDTWNVHYLRPGVWSNYRPLAELRSRFVTFTAEGHETGRGLSDCQLELEFRYAGKPVKTLVIDGPDGPTFGMVIPWNLLEEGQPTPEFVDQLGSLLDNGLRKQRLLREEPWIDRPVPRLLPIITDCSGYTDGRGGRTSDKRTLMAEYENLRLMGINGFRSVAPFMSEMVQNGQGLGQEFTAARISHAGGPPIPSIDRGDGRPPFRHPGDGCPYHPDNASMLPQRAAASAEHFREQASTMNVKAVYGLTVDEIGNIFGASSEGSRHPGSCPYCSEAFREMIRAEGRTPEDFGAASWDDIRPATGYWAKNYWESENILEAEVAKAEKAMNEAAHQQMEGEVEFSLDPEAEKVDHAANLLAARERLKALVWNGTLIETPADQREHNLSDEGWHLLEYYSRRFLNRATGDVFKPLADEIEKLNHVKREALARGETDSPAATRPWLYSYALRQPAFLWGGHSLDFFDFYRRADNAFSYETSNRDRRVWHWDSYLNDVGRTIKRTQDKPFTIYIKPHRGAGAQRALSAVARGVEMIYWYTYGPEWQKGDGWGGRDHLRSSVAYVDRIIAAAEEVTFGADWAVPAEVAIVRPRTAEFFSGSSSWENGKWVYSALMHAHIPVDAIDEVMIETSDLSQYKAIVVAGSHLRRQSAERLKQFVADGGTLYTCGYGMALDEAGRPLTLLNEVFGLQSRGEFNTWGVAPRYGATSLRTIQKTAEPPADANVTGSETLTGSFAPQVGIEVLDPLPGATVLATNASGKPVAVRNQFGKGSAYLIGTFAGLEYAWETMQNQPFSDDKRAWIAGPILSAGVRPVMKTDNPQVEGVLMEHPDTGRQALVITNWALDPLTDCQVSFRGFGDRTSVTSSATQRKLEARIDGEWMHVTLPELTVGDILLIE